MSSLIRVDVGEAELACLVDGPEDGPLVLCAHGFPDGARSFREQVGPLTERGFRVVSPWMRGYAPSSVAHDGHYSPAALGADLCALALRFSDKPARLVGHDWGAIGAYAATAFAPHLWSHLCTVAVPHLRVAASRFATAAQMRRSWYMGLFQVPYLAERKLAADGMALVDRLWHDWSPGYSPPPDALAEVKAGFAQTENLKAVLGYYRQMASPAALFGESRKLVFQRTTIPAIYVHGEDDGCIGVELCEGLEAAYSAGVEVHRLKGAGHFAHLEQPAAFNRILLDFLAS